MKRFIKTVCVIVSLVCLLAVPVCADETGTYSSVFFAAYDSSIDNPYGNTIRIWFDVVGNGCMDEIGSTSIVLECSSDGVNWTSVKKYLAKNYSYMICENASIAYDYVVYNGTYGNYYRAKVTFYAKNSRGTGYTWEYTEVLYLQSQ